MADDNLSFVDRMAEDEPSDDSAVEAATPDAAQGNGADSGAPPAAAAPAPDMSATSARLDRMEEQLFQSRQEAAYWRGQASRDKQAEQAPAVPRDEFNPDTFKADFDADPREAIVKAARAIARDEARRAGTEVEGRVTGQMTGNQRLAETRAALEREGQEVMRDYGDLVGNDSAGKPLNADFSRECWDYAQSLAKQAGNPILQQGPNAGAHALTPGQMRAAADAVYGRWARANKLPAPKQADAPTAQPRSLQRLIDEVPRSDNPSGNGARGARSNGVPKTIEDLAETDHFGPGDKQKHIRAAKAMCRQMGWDESNYVKNIIEARRNGELDG